MKLVPSRRTFAITTWACGLTTLLVTQSGCLGLLSNFMHTIGADRVPAEYADLEDSKVAIVTLTDSSQYSDDIVARLLTRKVGDKLMGKIDDMKLVREDDVQQYRDRNGYDSVDFAEIGKGVDADKVVGIEITDLKLRDGATLYRGRATVRLTVTDVATDVVLFAKDIDEYTYPRTAGQYTSETTESRFRKLFLDMLAAQIARTFHPYDFHETIALDGAIASQ